jgi:hypothetical protein
MFFLPVSIPSLCPFYYSEQDDCECFGIQSDHLPDENGGGGDIVRKEVHHNHPVTFYNFIN